MYNIRHHALMSILALAAFTSCSDDIDVKQALPVTSDDATLLIMIPNVEGAAEFGATRADEFRNTRAYNDASEAAIKSLWFFAYPVDSNESPIIVKLTDSELDQSVEQGNSVFDYKVYKVNNFVDGKYHIYVLANLDNYTDVAFDTATPEETVRSLALNFSTDKYLKSGELPMACLNTEVHDGSGSGNSSGEFEFKRSSNKTKVYCDLTFLCSKVRFTILYDLGSFSKSFNSTDNPDFTDVTVNNVRAKYSLIGTTSGDTPFAFSNSKNSSLFAHGFGKVKYPASSESKYIKGFTDKNDYEDNLETVMDWTDPKQRAWQGVVYLPVNAGEKKTTLSFATNSSSIESAYNVDKISQEGNLAKGTFYDLVAHLTTPTNSNLDFTVTVHDWTTRALQYQLHGPYELEVETTKISVSSSSPAQFWYRSDVAPQDIRFVYPMIKWTDSEGEHIEGFYKATVMTDDDGNYLTHEITGEYMIEVKINPGVPFSVLNNVNTGNDYTKSDYMYFELVAGNLQKKIEVDPLELTPFLNVSPQNVNIDVRTYVNSGINADDIELLIETNISDEITIEGLSTIQFGENTGSFSSPLYEMELATGDNLKSLTNTGFSITEGWGVLKIHLEKFFKASEFWKKEQTITFKVKASNNGLSREQDVTIKIRPYTTDYVIHFYPKNLNWGNPHIYVYQCLKLPSNLTGDNEDYAGYTVGYEDEGNQLAALEYGFTQEVAFKGWYGYGGPVDNNPNADHFDPSESWTNGFFIFKDGTQGKQGQTYKPGSDRYFSNMHFNDIHKSGLIWRCDNCSNGEYTSSGYPGIVMEQETGENAGWWKYTLSGVATPGKAMIMFNESHSSGGDGFRYPGNNQVGVPLFDFPDNEGWFIFDGTTNRHDLNFYDDKPQTPTIYKYRFYWQTTDTSKDMFFTAVDKLKFAWSKGYNQANSNWQYIEFYATETSGSIKYKVDGIYNTGEATINNALQKFVTSTDEKAEPGIRYAYVKGGSGGADLNSIISGFPPLDSSATDPTPKDPNKFNPGDVMTIIWYDYGGYNNFTYIYAWGQDDGTYYPFGAWSGEKARQEGNKFTAEFTFTQSESQINIDVHNKNNSGNNEWKYWAKPNLSKGILDNSTSATIGSYTKVTEGDHIHYTFYLW